MELFFFSIVSALTGMPHSLQTLLEPEPIFREHALGYSLIWLIAQALKLDNFARSCKSSFKSKVWTLLLDNLSAEKQQHYEQHYDYQALLVL